MKKRVLAVVLTVMTAMSVMACGDSASEGISAHGFESIPDGAHPDDRGQSQQEEEPAEEEKEAYVLPDDMYYSELTGEPISKEIEDQRPVAIMVDNDQRALPHFGISDCDVMYELMNSTANNRITRLMCLFKDWGSIEKVGSIRSIRPTNILLGQEWDAVLCHDGGPFYGTVSVSFFRNLLPCKERKTYGVYGVLPFRRSGQELLQLQLFQKLR